MLSTPAEVKPTPEPDVLLSVRDLSVAFHQGRVRVVEGFNLDLRRGERYALVGESGAGKSVAARALMRLDREAQYQGQIVWRGAQALLGAGRELLSASEREMRGLRGREMAMVFQEPMAALNPLMKVGRQITELIELHEAVSRSEAKTRALELLQKTGVDRPEERFNAYPHQLSGGQRQRVMMAMALSCRPQLLIADEPTTALDVTLREQVLRLLADMQLAFGLTVLLITHDLALVRRFADRAGVMRDGRLVEEGPVSQVLAYPQNAYTQLLLDAALTAGDLPAPETGAPVLAAQEVQCAYPQRAGFWRTLHRPVVSGVDFALAPGETLGVVGESGSGKTTLGLSLLKLSSARLTGQVRFGDLDVAQASNAVLRPLRPQMQVVFQDPFNALNPRLTIEQIVGEGLAVHHADWPVAERRARVVAMLQEVGLDGSMLNRYPHEFSGGQRQRIAIARAAILRPRLMLLDEPTSALDASVQKQVIALLVDLQKRYGVSYLLITHDLAVIRAMAHRVMVLQGGGVVESGVTQQVLDRPQQAYTRLLMQSAFAVGRI